MTGIATYFVHRSTTAEDKIRFDYYTRQAETDILARTDLYRALLRSGRALFSSSDTVTIEEFKRFIAMQETVSRFPGIQGMGYAKRFTNVQRDFVERILFEMYGDSINVFPQTQREEFYPIIYLEPQDIRNRAALGYDMYTDPVRRRAMDRARDTGYSVASGKVMLVQEIDNEKQAGFLIYLPVYRDGIIPATLEERRSKLSGFIYGPFRADDLLTQVFDRDSAPRIGFEVYDSLGTAPERLMHQSAGLHNGGDRIGRFTETRVIYVATRPWTIVYKSTAAFDRFSSKSLVHFIFTIGSLVSIMLYLIVRNQAEGRRRAEITAWELQSAKEAAEQASTAKDQFLAVLSHELRTPLTPILTTVDLIETDMKVGEELRPWIEVIRRNVELEARLIDDLLDITRISRGKIELHRSAIDAHHILDHVCEIVEADANEKDVKLVFNKEATQSLVYADPARLQQIYWNLVKNAIKFTPEGGTVSVLTRNKLDMFVIEVSDTGIGIGPEILPRIFDAFEQGEKTITRVFGGLGLGLAITKSLVELHGGTITAESTGRNKGATFIVTLPLATPDHTNGRSA